MGFILLWFLFLIILVFLYQHKLDKQDDEIFRLNFELTQLKWEMEFDNE